MLDADAVIIVLQLAAEMIFETATRHNRRRIRAEEEVYWHEIFHVGCHYDCKRKIFSACNPGGCEFLIRSP